MENKKEVITYDYKTVRVRRDMETMTTDAYENLGWEFVGSNVSGGAIFHINISFKRDRKIANKQELLKAQDKVDKVLLNVEYLKNKKKTAGLSSGITTGIIGTLALGGGMAMVIEGTGTTAILIGGIALGVVGLGICALAWLIGKKVKNRKIAKIDPMLEDEYNKLADYCEEVKKI